jgi:hypothetical protein
MSRTKDTPQRRIAKVLSPHSRDDWPMEDLERLALETLEIVRAPRHPKEPSHE